MYNSTMGVVDVMSVATVNPNKVQDLLQAIAMGPVVVSVDSSSTVFAQYTSGIMNAQSCGTDVNL